MDYLLKKSLMQNEQIEIIYLKDDGTFSKRRIIVKKIEGNQINAYCLLKVQPRTFKKESILAASPVKRHFERGLRYA